jgi:hypothetical protein
MDKAAVVLSTPQIPLVKTRYMEFINNEENCYGENAIVAIMCYTGYNMEDAVLVNEGALKRGLFRTTYYTTYETHEEKVIDAEGNPETEKVFTNIENSPNIIGTKPGYEYQHLDQSGLVREGTEVHDKMVLIGMSAIVDPKTGLRKDASKTPKKGQLGIVDKSFMTEGEEGQRIAKVRVREIRIPAIGDKMASRSGQKGTIGLVIPEADMPFTRDGIIPDIIVNPHAIPTRMTIGHLVECITGKACAMAGYFGDGTAYQSSGVGQYADILMKHQFHSSGNDILYNGMTGGQIEAEIFFGPTYYMRLKHMVKDKINFRTQGPRTALTRQPVSGRANDGGLRIGEMERDGLVAHGAVSMLTESMMERSDKYFMAVCNKTGLIAVYNPDKNLFMSPMADGPLQFSGSLAEDNMAVERVTKHGRDFSIVRVPYALKLLIQELQTINVVMRIITDENIDQISNMSFSKHVLLDKSMKEYVADLDNKIAHSIKPALAPLSEPESSSESVVEKRVPVSPAYAPGSPAYAPDGSPQYNPNSPEYAPDGSPQYNPNSPEYAPDGSPQYNPNSPEYAPDGSPQYNPNSPAYAEDSPEMKGGGSLYQLGDTVHLNSYKGENNYWTVQNIGDEFLTIEKYGGGGGSQKEVVQPMDICHAMPQSMPMSMPYAPNMFDQPMINPYLNQNPGAPPININVVTGNDNKVGEAVPAQKKSESIQGGSAFMNETITKTASTKAEAPPAAEPKEKSFWGGILEGAKNILVKKTG